MIKTPELKRALKNYYLFLAPAFFALFLMGVILKMYPLSILYILLAYLIPCALETPGLKFKTQTRKYSFSFIKILFVIRESSQRLLPLKEAAQLRIGRHIPSLLLVNVLYVFNPQGNLAAWFLGAAFFELSFYVYTSRYVSTQEGETENPQDSETLKSDFEPAPGLQSHQKDDVKET